ncbi:MAG: hypothetical protein ACHQIO_00620 [Nevskiales bacterium]
MQVTLTATSASGSVFTGWSGDCSGTGSCQVFMDRVRNVTPNFELATDPQQTLQLIKAGGSSGRVSSSPTGIDCGAQCTAEFTRGTVVTLTATPDAGAVFSGWSGACTGTATCQVTLGADMQVTASFVNASAAAPQGMLLSGDTHVHDDHSSDGSLPRQLSGDKLPGNVSVADQISEGELQGLDFMPLTDHRTYTQQYDPLWRSSKLILVPGEEANGSPHATVHGAIDTIVQQASPAGAPSWVNLQQSIWNAHSQDANWGTAHPDDGEMNADGTPNANANAVGMDTVEVWNRASAPDTEIDYAEGRWNLGYRFGIAGACDDHFKELWSVSGPGMPTTQVFSPRKTALGVVAGLRSGRTAVYSGFAGTPSASLEGDFQNDGVFEAMQGDEVIATPGTKGQLRLTVQNGFGTTVFLYQAPGRSAGAIQTFMPDSVSLTSTYLIDVTAGPGPTWFRAEVRGPGEPAGLTGLTALNFEVLFDQLRAVTSPIFVSPSVVAAQPAVPLPADQGTDDGARNVLGTPGQFAGFPDVARSKTFTHVVAEVHQNGTSHIQYVRVGAAGNAAPLDLAPTSSDARFPHVAAFGTDVWVVWQDDRNGELPYRTAVFMRHSSDEGATWEPEVLVRNPENGRAEHPSIATDGNGRVMVAWQEIGNGVPFDVWAQLINIDAEPVNLSAPNKTFAEASPLDTRSARYPASVWPTVAASSTGEFAVAWEDDREDKDPLWTGGYPYGSGTDPDDWQIYVTTRPAGLSGWLTPTSLGSHTQADRHPTLAYAADGSLVAAWDAKNLSSSGANLSILSSSFTAKAGWSAVVPVSLDTNTGGEYPRLGLDGSGNVVLVRQDSRSTDWRWRVLATSRAADGSWGTGTVIQGKGLNMWPALSGGTLVFASTRDAQRLQRDHTQEIYTMQVPTNP